MLSFQTLPSSGHPLTDDGSNRLAARDFQVLIKYSGVLCGSGCLLDHCQLQVQVTIDLDYTLSLTPSCKM